MARRDVVVQSADAFFFLLRAALVPLLRASSCRQLQLIIVLRRSGYRAILSLSLRYHYQQTHSRTPPYFTHLNVVVDRRAMMTDPSKNTFFSHRIVAIHARVNITNLKTLSRTRACSNAESSRNNHNHDSRREACTRCERVATLGGTIFVRPQ